MTVHQDTVKEETRLLFESTELPPLGEHVAQVVNEGIQQWLRQEREERSFEKEIQDAIEATAQLWDEEFARAEEFN